jgi:hypothetical protein
MPLLRSYTVICTPITIKISLLRSCFPESKMSKLQCLASEATLHSSDCIVFPPRVEWTHCQSGS